jgi:hypothetical protein
MNFVSHVKGFFRTHSRANLFFKFLFVIWISALLLNVHGYSISAWGPVLGSATPYQIGHAQSIRSDDYSASLPLAFSQMKSGYSSINPFISLGQES